jgi:hypothetical protein
MKLAVFRSLWGYSASPHQAAQEIAAAGYDGIEAELPSATRDRSALMHAVKAAGLRFIPLISIEPAAPMAQLEATRRRLGEAAEMAADRAVLHAGRDSWSVPEAVSFYAAIAEVEQDAGIAVAHETHRGRPLMNPWSTLQVVEAVPSMRLCCDLSHWVVVCERLLEDQEEAIEVAAERTIHIHARVGSAQGPQVSDPSDPRFETELDCFERWWDIVWDRQAEAGIEVSTLTPEYGPPPYQPPTVEAVALPAKLSEACDWQAARARARFAQREGVSETPAGSGEGKP